MIEEDIEKNSKTQDIIDRVKTSNYLNMSLVEWRSTLAPECQVYVFGESYLAKRFDEINFAFCSEDEATRILTDNLYALLRYKYFITTNDRIDDRIKDIIHSFTQNLRSTLIKVSFDEEDNTVKVNFLPDGCIAYRNGVFDFIHNDWLFKYDVITIPSLHNRLYLYDENGIDYIIMWYFNCDFVPRKDVDIMTINVEDFIKMLKEETLEKPNLCFELMYNMSHDSLNNFSNDKFNHLCEILGYSCLQSFSQNFVMMIGSGQNGKNSLFDGCLSCWLRPRPASNSLDTIEEDKFITGSLENKTHNFFLESSAKTYNESKMIKALTGSMYQSIENKGVRRYSGLINCKYVFAGNDQDNIKFTDTTIGFKRRINVFEITYRWDPLKKFLRKGDYYDTSFDDSLNQLKTDINNLFTLSYLAMYGIKEATDNFTDNFKFTYNDWRITYSDTNIDVKTKLDTLTIDDVLSYIKTKPSRYDEFRTFFFEDDKKTMLYKITQSQTFAGLVELFQNPEECATYFSNNDFYMQVKFLQDIVDAKGLTFTKDLRTLYSIVEMPQLYANRAYVHCRLTGKKITFLPT